MFEDLSSKLPQDYWELGPKPVKPRVFTSIALKPIEMAPDMVLHSPILAKSVSGSAGRRLLEVCARGAEPLFLHFHHRNTGTAYRDIRLRRGWISHGRSVDSKAQWSKTNLRSDGHAAPLSGGDRSQEQGKGPRGKKRLSGR